MKFELRNLGALEIANFELGDLTVICGKNNSGKTYVTYSVYGLLNHLKTSLSDSYIHEDDISTLLEKGRVVINLFDILTNIPKEINEHTRLFSAHLSEVFAGESAHFSDSSISVSDINNVTGLVKPGFSQVEINGVLKYLVSFNVPEDKTQAKITIEWKDGKLPDIASGKYVIGQSLSNSIKEYIFRSVIPRVYISSAERTGAAIFQRELDFTRNRLLEILGDKASKITPTVLFDSFHGEYPVAVRANVDFIRNIPNLTNKESRLVTDHPELLVALNDLMEGTYSAAKDGSIRYLPTAGRKVKLQLGECSSSVRALLDMDFYIRHIATPGDIYMIDEPEMNLHPARQRKLARFFARLVNCGIRVFITTHSDYLIREFSTLLMLNQPIEKCKRIAIEEGYESQELLTAKNLRVYIADKAKVKKDGNSRATTCNTLTSATFSQGKGIEIASFDDTIDQMNAIQDRLLWE